MSDFGAKVSQVGNDVKTATPQNLVYTSGLSSYLFKIMAKGTLSFANNSGTLITIHGVNYRRFTLNHNLGYVPTFLAYVRETSFATEWLLTNDSIRNPTTYSGDVEALVDSSNLYLYVFDSGANPTYNFSYILFVESIT